MVKRKSGGAAIAFAAALLLGGAAHGEELTVTPRTIEDLKAVFGQNLNHVWEEGLTVQVGDQIEVLQRDNYRNFTLLSEAA